MKILYLMGYNWLLFQNQRQGRQERTSMLGL